MPDFQKTKLNFTPFKLLLSFFIIFISQCGFSQQLYWIFFTDKPNTEFDPYEYFDAKAIERRIRESLPLYDERDLPLNDFYKREALVYSKYLGESRWLNALIVESDADQIKNILKLPFVREALPLNLRPEVLQESDSAGLTLARRDSVLIKFQTKRMQGELFLEAGLTGKGIRIAVFDTGFPGVDTHPAFDHLRKGNKIIKTYDFIKKEEAVYHGFFHGTSVLSCIAGMFGDIPVGLATEAEFVLARTERALSEFKYEEYTWILAAEWADKNGAEIISSSLGYSNNRYFRENLTGRFSPVAQAANIAASKGILVINAAGNEANNRWEKLVTPADADSVLAVGAIDPYKDIATVFSSFGPTTEYRLKPNVSAIGIVIAANTRRYSRTQGTSFAAPLVAGFAACAWQAHRELKAMELFKLIELSGSLYPYYDYVHGYGIPLASRAISQRFAMADSTFTFAVDGDSVKVVIASPFIPDSTLEKDKLPVQNLFYKFSEGEERLYKFGVITVERQFPIKFALSDFKENDLITIHFEGYTDSFRIHKDD